MLISPQGLSLTVIDQYIPFIECKDYSQTYSLQDKEHKEKKKKHKEKKKSKKKKKDRSDSDGHSSD